MSGSGRNELPLRLYKIQNDIHHYHAGHLSSGNQVLMDEAHRLEFDLEGNLIAAFGHETSQTMLTAYDVEGKVLATFTQEEVPLPSMMLPFMPGTISVKPFFLPEAWLGIRDLPDHYQDFLDNPENADEEQRQYYPEEIRDWRECGNFVLWWNEDYFLNAEGELESS